MRSFEKIVYFFLKQLNFIEIKRSYIVAFAKSRKDLFASESTNKLVYRKMQEKEINKNKDDRDFIS